jgi:uncharacterized protein (TIGR03437 family)
VRVAVDASGYVYLAGNTWSRDFPTTPGAYRRVANLLPEDYQEAYVMKVHPSGNSLVYSTFLGGSRSEYATGLCIDTQGNVTVAGLTNSPDFPQTDTPQSVPHAVGFLTRLNSAGSQVLYSSLYLGGPFDGLADAGNGRYHVFGSIRDEFAPTQGVFQTTLSPHFVAKFILPNEATTVSAASYDGSPLASEAIVSMFGSSLATTTKGAATIPLPLNLEGTIVRVRDSSGMEREASLFFVSPTQVNFQIPPGTANGTATITIISGDGAVSVSQVQIVNVAPSIFSADATGRGIAAAQVQRTGSVNFEPVFRFDVTRGQIVGVPIDLGPSTEQVYLVLYGTGIRLRSNLNQVTATIGGTNASVSYAGSQNGFVGLDQVNILIPRSLIGRGLVDVSLNVEGKLANIVQLTIK